MDIVYVLGDGSKQNNLELRISLRSICKYANGIGKVVVLGNPPVWLSDEVATLAVKDKYPYKHSNILLCIEKAIEAGLIKGEFLYSSDDHFYIRKVDFNSYPYFFKKTELCKTANKTDPYYQYHKSLYDTRCVLRKYGMPTINYSQHCNTHMHTGIFTDIIDIIHETYKLPYGVEPTTLIMNAWAMRSNAPHTVPREDVKITRADDLQSLWRQIGNRDCFSVGDSIFNGKAIRQLFAVEFPDKCLFEKN